MAEKKVRTPSQSAEFHRIRHLAAIKCWQKRKRKGEQAKVGAAAAGAVAVGGGRVNTIGQRSLGFDTGQVGGPVQSRGDYAREKAVPHARLEREMQTSPQNVAHQNNGAVPNMGKGISEAYKLYLESGQKCNFKPDRGEVEYVRDGIVAGQAAERELGAWEVAKLVGLDDMVAPVVIREADVPGGYNAVRGFPPGRVRGSAALWQDGEVAKFVKSATERYDGEEDQRRAAMFDFIIGNQDRHAGNWVVSGSGKLKLIDHGLAFGEKKLDPRYRNRQILFRVASRDAGSVAKYAESYVKNKDKIKAALVKVGLPAKAIRRVMSRIDRVSTYDWADLGWDEE